MIDKTFFEMLTLWLLAIVFMAVCETIIFHQANMIFKGRWFNYPDKYRLDAWHVAKLCFLLCFFLYGLINTDYSMVEYIWLFIMFGGLTGLVHYLFFHVIFIKR